jgi:transketolase
MKPVLRDEIGKGRTLREAYVGTLMEIAERDERLVILDADCVGSSGVAPFFKKYPDRAFNCGIQEQDMIGIAAGLSITGKVPFAHSFGTFATPRVADQVFQSAAYSRLNVRIVGSDPGICATQNGGTHMPFEDAGTLRSIAEITILDPSDSVMYANLLKQLMNLYTADINDMPDDSADKKHCQKSVVKHPAP